MTRLYGYKWVSKEGEIDPQYPLQSYGFKLWCEKTSHLTPNQWKAALDRCEKELREAAAQGKDCWPPSYPEFIGYADESVRTGAYKVLPRALPVPEEIRSKRKKKGIEGCKKILNILGE